MDEPIWVADVCTESGDETVVGWWKEEPTEEEVRDYCSEHVWSFAGLFGEFEIRKLNGPVN